MLVQYTVPSNLDIQHGQAAAKTRHGRGLSPGVVSGQDPIHPGYFHGHNHGHDSISDRDGGSTCGCTEYRGRNQPSALSSLFTRPRLHHNVSLHGPQFQQQLSNKSLQWRGWIQWARHFVNGSAGQPGNNPKTRFKTTHSNLTAAESQAMWISTKRFRDRGFCATHTNSNGCWAAASAPV